MKPLNTFLLIAPAALLMLGVFLVHAWQKHGAPEYVRIAEIGPVHAVINHPAHPYTAGLMAAIPDMESERDALYQIDGAMPRLDAIPPGCAFNPRCPRGFQARCRTERPELIAAGPTQAACWLHDPASGVTA